MNNNSAGSPDSTLPLAHRLLQYVTSSWMAQAICVAAELQIADLLAEGPRSIEDIAAITGTHAPSLHRLLRALTTIDICREREDGSFEMTVMGSLLRTDAPLSQRCWTLWWGTHLWPVWEKLQYSIKTGEGARKLLTGKEGFGHLEQEPETAAIFHQALAELTRLTAQGVVRTFDFSDCQRIMDVGGGYGELLIAILKANPAASGILFDLPHAIEGGKQYLERAGLSSRCEFLTGNFFESVPGGSDTYVLKSVIHDWDDDSSKRILENCHRAMPGNGRLILVERVLPDRLESSEEHRAAVCTDLTMLVALGGRERTATQFRNLLIAAGFRTARILPVSAGFCVIEALPD